VKLTWVDSCLFLYFFYLTSAFFSMSILKKKYFVSQTHVEGHELVNPG